jgi:hypothetical protein
METTKENIKIKKGPRRFYAGSLMKILLGAGIAFRAGWRAEAAPLPDALGEWQSSRKQITDLTASEDLGRWSNCVYTRASPVAGVEVNLMEGPGPGTLYVPEGEVDNDDGLLGFSSTYETLIVAGKRAILERGDATGQALAVALAKRTLTLETKSLSKEKLLDFAEKLIGALEKE